MFVRKMPQKSRIRNGILLFHAFYILVFALGIVWNCGHQLGTKGVRLERAVKAKICEMAINYLQKWVDKCGENEGKLSGVAF